MRKEHIVHNCHIGQRKRFFDTVNGAKYNSLIETTQAKVVEPYACLTLVLTDMQDMGRPFSNEELESFMPWSEELAVE